MNLSLDDAYTEMLAMYAYIQTCTRWLYAFSMVAGLSCQ